MAVNEILVGFGVRLIAELLREGIEFDQIVEGLLADGSVSPEKANEVALKVQAAGDKWKAAREAGAI